MGSLIKNAGGTLAPGGGYVAGRADLVAAVGARLAAPGIGTDAGGVPGTTMRILFQGELGFRLEKVNVLGFYGVG
jgi:cystathionine beta-lyase family protein involved in aluminum resistance